jgi:hypothetical protein
MEYIFTSFFLIYANKQNTKNHKPSTSKNKSKNLQHLRIRARTFNIQEQKQKPLISKSKNKNFQHLKPKVRTLNIQE